MKKKTKVKISKNASKRIAPEAHELPDLVTAMTKLVERLESLEKKGFIIMKIGKPIKFVALKP